MSVCLSSFQFIRSQLAAKTPERWSLTPKIWAQQNQALQDLEDIQLIEKHSNLFRLSDPTPSFIHIPANIIGSLFKEVSQHQTYLYSASSSDEKKPYFNDRPLSQSLGIKKKITKLQDEKKPVSTGMLFNLAKTLLFEKKFAEAIKLFKELDEIHEGKNAEVKYHIAMAYRNAHVPADAIPYIQQAIQLNPQKAAYQKMLTECESRLKK